MRYRSIAILAAAAATLAIPSAAFAGASQDRATGGGQVLVSTDQTTGPGSTIAFTAQTTGEAEDDMAPPAKGQVQIVDRTAGTGQAQVKFHGTVTCLMVMGNQAELGGIITKTTSPDQEVGDPFSLYVQDNGEGANAPDADMVVFNPTPANPCNDEIDDDGKTALARGNAQVYDASMQAAKAKKRAAAKKRIRARAHRAV
jgi:hypothetical protein